MRSQSKQTGKRRRLLVVSVLSFAVLLTIVFLGCRPTPPTAAQRPTKQLFQPVQMVPAQPAIKDAPVIDTDQVREQVTDTELVLGVVIHGAARAYPINMLTGPSREIINDSLGGQAIAATW